jgi:hypothetical protein
VSVSNDVIKLELARASLSLLKRVGFYLPLEQSDEQLAGKMA